MELQFFGAAQTVTGSRHLLNVNGKKILLECGLFQGRRKDTYEKNLNFKFDPAEIDVMILSHAHIDHSGNIPNLVKQGFKGNIYATAATVDLCQLMLRDSAYLQEKDIEWVNKKKERRGEELIEPLYTIEDAERAMQQFIGIQYDKTIEVAKGVKLTFRDAGHILGSAGVLLEINEDGKKLRLGFSGDVGRNEMPILRNPNVLRDLDALIIESTYGDRVHPVEKEVEEELAQKVRDVIQTGGKLIIPAFAVGRTQLIVYMLHRLFDENRIPNIPVFIDSPLATNVTEVFRQHPECFDREMYRIYLQDDKDPFGFGRATFIRKAERSKELNDYKKPCVIISASGMAEGGRILHHLRNNIEEEKNMVLFVGYAAQHTLARRIMDGNKVIKIFGEEFTVNARVEKMDYFSGHADKNELLDYIKFNKPEKLKNIFLVHGEDDQALPLKNEIEKLGYKNVFFPEVGGKFQI